MRAVFDSNPNSILIPTQPLRPLVFGEYLDRGTEHKLFAGESITSVCRTPSDPYLYYIVSGCIGAEFTHEDGTALPLYQRTPGTAFQSEFAGIASLGTTRLRFVALENSLVVSFTYEQVYAFVRELPQAFEDLVYLTHVSFGQFGHRLDNVSSHSASQSLIFWIKKLMDTNEPDDDGRYRIPCRLTMQELADLLFMHVTTCSRLMSALKAQNIVDRTNNYLFINDPRKLNELAQQEKPFVY